MSEPIIRRDDYWADVWNSLLLRPVYREPVPTKVPEQVAEDTAQEGQVEPQVEPTADTPQKKAEDNPTQNPHFAEIDALLDELHAKLPDKRLEIITVNGTPWVVVHPEDTEAELPAKTLVSAETIASTASPRSESPQEDEREAFRREMVEAGARWGRDVRGATTWSAGSETSPEVQALSREAAYSKVLNFVEHHPDFHEYWMEQTPQGDALIISIFPTLHGTGDAGGSVGDILASRLRGRSGAAVISDANNASDPAFTEALRDAAWRVEGAVPMERNPDGSVKRPARLLMHGQDDNPDNLQKMGFTKQDAAIIVGILHRANDRELAADTGILEADLESKKRDLFASLGIEKAEDLPWALQIEYARQKEEQFRTFRLNFQSWLKERKDETIQQDTRSTHQ